MALEESGVPSVAVHTHAFARLARASALANGMPRTRQALQWSFGLSWNHLAPYGKIHLAGGN